MHYVYWLKNQTCFAPERDGYVGITNNPMRRLSQHKKSSKFPVDIEMVILFEGSEEECLAKEFSLRSAENIGWNVVPGGGKPPVCRKMSEETKRKISETRRRKAIRLSPESVEKMRQTKLKQHKPAWNRGLKVTDETWLKNLSESHKGNVPSEETRQKISEAHKGKAVSDDTREKLRQSNLGKRASEETKEKIRAAHQGRKQTPETIEKKRLAQTGKKRSPEFRQKMRQIALARKKNG